MTIVPLRAELLAATSLLDLARRLGEVCLAEERHLTRICAAEETEPQRLYLEGLVAAIDPLQWQARPPHGFVHLLDEHELEPVIRHLSTYSPLEHLAFVRGLCARALTNYFEQTEEKILLDRGLPLPFAIRPFNKSFTATTPSAETLAKRGLLRGLGYQFFRHAATESIQVTLDFRHRDRLDSVTWSEALKLPLVATLHPPLGDGQIDFTQQDSSFFDVKPKHWSLEDTLEWLRSVRHQQIAILPELSLPSPCALAASLAEAPCDYPPLIVAGSAHVRVDGDAVRANESHVYLDGQPVTAHRKIQPLETQKLGARLFSQGLCEAITREPKDLVVLSGEHTRLAVVICADLNDSDIPGLLEATGVNLLLVPALTYSAGAFNGTVCHLASQCQAVCVVVNADLSATNDGPVGATENPFLVLASVPRPDPQDQSRAYYRDPADRVGLPRGIFDPNIELDEAMCWEAPLAGDHATN